MSHQKIRGADASWKPWREEATHNLKERVEKVVQKAPVAKQAAVLAAQDPEAELARLVNEPRRVPCAQVGNTEQVMREFSALVWRCLDFDFKCEQEQLEARGVLPLRKLKFLVRLKSTHTGRFMVPGVLWDTHGDVCRRGGCADSKNTRRHMHIVFAKGAIAFQKQMHFFGYQWGAHERLHAPEVMLLLAQKLRALGCEHRMYAFHGTSKEAAELASVAGLEELVEPAAPARPPKAQKFWAPRTVQELLFDTAFETTEGSEVRLGFQMYFICENLINFAKGGKMCRNFPIFLKAHQAAIAHGEPVMVGKPSEVSIDLKIAFPDGTQVTLCARGKDRYDSKCSGEDNALRLLCGPELRRQLATSIVPLSRLPFFRQVQCERFAQTPRRGLVKQGRPVLETHRLLSVINHYVDIPENMGTLTPHMVNNMYSNNKTLLERKPGAICEAVMGGKHRDIQTGVLEGTRDETWADICREARQVHDLFASSFTAAVEGRFYKDRLQLSDITTTWFYKAGARSSLDAWARKYACEDVKEQLGSLMQVDLTNIRQRVTERTVADL